MMTENYDMVAYLRAGPQPGILGPIPGLYLVIASDSGAAVSGYLWKNMLVVTEVHELIKADLNHEIRKNLSTKRNLVARAS
jgi:hypothetical protein